MTIRRAVAGAGVLAALAAGGATGAGAAPGGGKLPSCAEPPAGTPRLESYEDLKVPATYWVDMIWQNKEWRPAEHLPMLCHHATRLELTNAGDFPALAAHRAGRVRFTLDITSVDIRQVPRRNQWRATYHARVVVACVPR